MVTKSTNHRMQLYNSIDVTQIEYKWITDGIVIWNYNISDKIYETNKHLIIKSKQIIIKKTKYTIQIGCIEYEWRCKYVQIK